MSNHPELVESKNGVLLAVHVQPGAGSTAAVGRHGDALKVRIGAPPTGGRANKALVEFVAKEFGLSASAVEIVSGDAARAKRVRLGELDLATAAQHLERILGTIKHR